MSPVPPSPWPPAGYRGGSDGWRVAGIVLAVVVAAVGLVMVAAVVLIFVGAANFGSNK